MREKDIESKVARYAVTKMRYVRKFKSPGNRGVPDKVFLTPNGVVFFIEFKRKGEEPTELQAREIRSINSRGGNATYVDNVEDGKKYVDEMLKLKNLLG